MRPCRAIRWRRKEPVVLDLLQGVYQYTSVYKRGGHAPCSCDVTLKKKNVRSVGVDNCSALGGGMIKAEYNSATEHTLNQR